MISLSSFVDEFLKIAAGPSPEALATIKKVAPYAAAALGGAAVYGKGQSELQKYQLGRQVYAQQQGQGQGW